MPSSGAAGLTHRLLRIKRQLTLLSGATLDLGDATVTADGAEISITGGSFRLVPQASPPANAVEGVIYMDTDHKLMVHNGTTWAVIGSQS